ncbi:MAG: hypothetical protein GY804_00415, partial [Alphaproteobacteria bacterium]|nr:hypothetical protein [Alphaproteobacteria bacterium]
AMFYISLEDEFLQKALSDLKEPNPTIQHYYNEACAAEGRRQSFQDITQSSTCLENKGVNIAKWDIPYADRKKFSNRSNKSETSQGVKPKDTTQGKDYAKGNKSQNQQNSDQKSKTQNSKPNNADQTKTNQKWCHFHKSKSHTSKDCYVLKNNSKAKSVKKLDEDRDDSEPLSYGEFHSIEAVNPYEPVVKSFASVNDA